MEALVNKLKELKLEIEELEQRIAPGIAPGQIGIAPGQIGNPDQSAVPEGPPGPLP
jgi:hypothetical protein